VKRPVVYSPYIHPQEGPLFGIATTVTEKLSKRNGSPAFGSSPFSPFGLPFVS
jgi:hypothetical protein